MRRKGALSDILATIVLGIGAVIMLAPFLWMISTALKPADQVMVFPPRWIPSPVCWKNFSVGWHSLPFGRYTLNSCIITGLVVIGTILTSTMAGYTFARLRFPGKNVLFIVMLATMMLPSQVTMIPIFLMFRDIGWLNTFKPLTVPAWCGGGAVYIFLVRQFVMSLPVELDEAACLDGCSAIKTYWYVILPLLKPCLAVIAIFTFLGTWNDFMGPLIYLTTPDKATLALGLQFFQGHYGVTLHYLMAVSLMVMLPCLLLFAIAQKHFVAGVSATGIKG